MSPSFQEFLRLEPEAGLRFVLTSPEHAATVRRGFGEKAFEQFHALAEGTARASAEHLRVTPETNVLFFPGIMGSSLGSETVGGIWWLDLQNLGALNGLRLSPDGTTDVTPSDDVVPLTTDHRYSGFLTALRDQAAAALVHDRFPYDWRKSLRLSAAAARERIVEIHETNGGRPVHLVAHSMGGLLVRVTLMLHGDELWPRVGQIAFIGTPHYGATAMGGYLKNHFWGLDSLVVIAKFLDRATFRSMRGALELLPAPAGVYPGTRDGSPHPCANFDPHDAGQWHLDLAPDEEHRLQAVLDDAAQLQRDLLKFHGAIGQARRNKMLVVAGVGFKTLFRLEYRSHLVLWEKMMKVTSQVAGDVNRMGDGRVPVASAALEHVGATRYVRGVHAGLPNLPAVYRDVFAWLTGQPLQLPRSPAGALAQHLGPAALKSAVSGLDGTALASGDDPGYLDLDPVDEQHIAALVAAAEAGLWPELRFVSLL